MLAVISAAVARICTRGLIVIAGAYATTGTTCDFPLRFEEDAGRTRVNHRFEHASWAQTDGTSPLEHGHVSVACLKTSCRLPIRICTGLREMAMRSKSARITGTSCRLGRSYPKLGAGAASASAGDYRRRRPTPMLLPPPGFRASSALIKVPKVFSLDTSGDLPVVGFKPRSGATDQVPLWPKLCGSPSAVPTIIRIFKKRDLRY